jgi:integrase
MGFNPLGFHKGRHTYASIAIAAGLNAKTLSTYLGHATITITLDRYGNLMPGSEVEARAMLDAYLNNP